MKRLYLYGEDRLSVSQINRWLRGEIAYVPTDSPLRLRIEKLLVSPFWKPYMQIRIKEKQDE